MNAENSAPRRQRRVEPTADLPRCWLPHCDRPVTHSGEMCDRCRHAARVYPNEQAEPQQGSSARFEIETDDEQPDDHLPAALVHLAETIVTGTPGGYPVSVAEDDAVIFTSQGGSCDA